MVSEDDVKAVDAMRFAASDAGAAVQPAELAPNAQTDSNHADSASSDELDFFDASGALEDANLEPKPSTVAQRGEGCSESNNAAQPANQADHGADNVEQILDDDSSDHSVKDAFDISAFEVTTRAHDDWLHRWQFLFEMHYHMYSR